MKLDANLSPQEVLFSGIEALHPEVSRLRQIVDGWSSKRGLARGEVLDIALACSDWDITRRIILAETIKGTGAHRIWLEQVVRPFYEPKRVGWMRVVNGAYPLGAIIGLLDSITWLKANSTEPMTSVYDKIPFWFTWILSAAFQRGHWIREETDPLLPDPKWSGAFSDSFGQWRHAMLSALGGRNHWLGLLMFLYRGLFEGRSDQELASLDFGDFGSTILDQLSFALFSELTAAKRADLLWTGFVSQYGPKPTADPA